MAGLIYVPLGMLYYETNDPERACHHLTTGIALCQHMGTVYYALVGQQTLAKLYYARGEAEREQPDSSGGSGAPTNADLIPCQPNFR